jgi:hypothetical protein
MVSLMDADASQRQCIVACREGRSFVMDGPPGTGKSQTIANMVAELMFTGRSVLFVSEKAAALDVVRNRLTERKLGSFILELHSHKATRKEVASVLGRALKERPRAEEALTPGTREGLATERKQLTAWATAVNKIRHPLERSINDVLGRLYALSDVARLPLPTTIGSDLAQEDFEAILRDARRLANAWAPVEKGDDFLWRDVAGAEITAARRTNLEQKITDLIEAVEALKNQCQVLSADLGLGWSRSIDDSDRFLKLLSRLAARPHIPVHWLTTTEIESIEELGRRTRELADSLQSAEDTLQQLTGRSTVEGWAEHKSTLDSAVAGLESLHVPWRPDPAATSEQLDQARTALQSVGTLLTGIKTDASWLASTLGAAFAEETFQRASQLVELARFVGSPTPPESRWLSPVVQEQLRTAISVLNALVDDYRERQENLATVFTEDVLSLDLVGLKTRFDERHRGLAKLGRSYRADKRTLAACTVTGKVTKETLARLDEAVAWQALARKLDGAEAEHAGLLGSYYQDRATADFGRVTQAIEIAARALTLVGGGADYEALAHQLGRDGTPSPEIPTVAGRLDRAIHEVRTQLGNAIGAVSDRVLTLDLDTCVAWTEAAAEYLGQIVGAMGGLEGDDPRLSFDGALKVASNAERRHNALSELNDLQGSAEHQLGSFYRGRATNWRELEDALAWARGTREILGGPTDDVSARALVSTQHKAEELEPLTDACTKRLTSLLDEFAEPTRGAHEQDLRTSFDDSLNLLGQLRATIDDIHVWQDYLSARDALEHRGLAEGLRELEARRVSGDQVADSIERSVLEQWVDEVSRGDHRLQPVRTSDRDDLVAHFRRNDKVLLENAAARVVNACSQRRPRSNKGAAAHIQRQAELKRRHWPIRRLLTEAGAVAQQMKPCFMMSPLSVSQYLPPDLCFDVVIFDEASQVRPCDAVNSIYRGSQLIVAGDQKQLPPTNFFELNANADELDEDEPDEFDSVLDLAKGAGALPSLSLNWHYRSQHEDLIAYSNFRFYDGSLWTFPGSIESADDVGVRSIKVDGTYRRGTTRDNPVEAATVVERVLHHRRMHPELSLGVVTFSSAQEEAILAEIERQEAMYSELAELATSDRLTGFFVKNLENVQGDERDILIFSIGYGPDENGKLTMNFGPVNTNGGWRRLNVAITRARRRIEVVTSITGGQIRDTGSVGVRHLKNYLMFAERGHEALAQDINESLGDVESPFEDEVLRRIWAMGYDASPPDRCRRVSDRYRCPTPGHAGPVRARRRV